MFRVSSAHLQEDTIVYVHAAYGTVTLYESSWWQLHVLLKHIAELFLCNFNLMFL